MSCPERQIANLMEGVTEAIAKAARENSGLSLEELEQAARTGVTRAFESAVLPDSYSSRPAYELLGLLYKELDQLSDHDANHIKVGKLYNALHRPHGFNDNLREMERRGHVQLRDATDGPAINLTEQGLEFINAHPELSSHK